MQAYLNHLLPLLFKMLLPFIFPVFCVHNLLPHFTNYTILLYHHFLYTTERLVKFMPNTTGTHPNIDIQKFFKKYFSGV